MTSVSTAGGSVVEKIAAVGPSAVLRRSVPAFLNPLLLPFLVEFPKSQPVQFLGYPSGIVKMPVDLCDILRAYLRSRETHSALPFAFSPVRQPQRQHFLLRFRHGRNERIFHFQRKAFPEFAQVSLTLQQGKARRQRRVRAGCFKNIVRIGFQPRYAGKTVVTHLRKIG